MFNKNLTISSKAIDEYLSWGYIPAEKSIFNEVKKLKPGFKFVFDLESGNFKTACYWDIDRKQKQDPNINYNDAKSGLETLLTDATKIRLFADVPVGIFLSGGIDSSLITALASKSSNKKVKTFSIKFNDEGFDESSYAQQVANHLKTDHHTIVCDKNDGLDLIENFNLFYDEPFSDSSAIPSMLLAKHTREKVTVALTGDAGDENFLGYHRYDWLRIINYFMLLPFPIRKIIANGMSKMPNYRYKTVAMVINSKTIEEAYLKSVNNPSPSWKLPPKFETSLTEYEYLLMPQTTFISAPAILT